LGDFDWKERAVAFEGGVEESAGRLTARK